MHIELPAFHCACYFHSAFAGLKSQPALQALPAELQNATYPSTLSASLHLHALIYVPSKQCCYFDSQKPTHTLCVGIALEICTVVLGTTETELLPAAPAGILQIW